MKYLLLILVLFTTSCSKDFYFNKDQVSLSQNLKQIIKMDQEVRKNIDKINIKYKIRTNEIVFDSIVKSGGKVFGGLNVPSVQSQLQNKSSEVKSQYLLEMNENWALIKNNDSVNAIKILKIINKYGYPSFDNREWKSDTLKIGFLYVMTHIDVRSLIGKKIINKMVKEYKKGRVENGEMKQFLWHVDGRDQHDPFGQNLNINEWIEKFEKR